MGGLGETQVPKNRALRQPAGHRSAVSLLSGYDDAAAHGMEKEIEQAREDFKIAWKIR